jgi:hypothetical protein
MAARAGALEMAARAPPRLRWGARDDMAARACPRPQRRSRWLLDPVQGAATLEVAARACPESQRRSKSLLGEAVAVRLFFDSRCSAHLFFVHGYAQVRASFYIHKEM